jgi:SAM-dependent methyltransferase
MAFRSQDFSAVGKRFLEWFVTHGGLLPDHRVLDIGCGCGRVAIPLSAYLEGGSYSGIDIRRDGVDWCKQHLSPDHPNFSFQLADVYNRHYNPGGRHKAAEYVFPFDDNAFDFVCLISVFTHMLPAEMANYLAEVQRMLRPGGRCFITYFLWNSESSELVRSGRGAFDFRYDRGDWLTTDPDAPEVAVCYREDHVQEQYRRVGLLTKGKPLYGSWCGREQFLSGQDIIVAEKDR